MRQWFRVWWVTGSLLAALAMALPALAQAGTPIAYGQSVSGAITAEAPEVFYTFQGRAGEVITVAMSAVQPGLDSYVRLITPDGTELVDDDTGGNLDSLLGPYTLPADGTYTVVATRFGGLQGGSTGAYTLVVSQVALTPLTPGETFSLDLNDSQPAYFFSYPGAPGQVFSLTVQGLSGEAGFNVAVRDPFGNNINGAYSPAGGQALVDPLLLGEAGEYIFVVTRQFSDPTQTAGSARAALTLRQMTAQPLAIGATITGTLDDGNPSAHYTFEAAGGDILRLAGSEAGGGTPFEVQVIAPVGYYVNGGGTAYSEQPGRFAVDPLVLDSAGTHLLVIRRIDPDGQGVRGVSNYTVTLGPTETPQIAAGVEATGSFDGGAYERVYRFEGQSGQVVRVTLRSLNETYGPSLSWQGPSADLSQVGPGGPGMGGGGYPGGTFIVDMNGALAGTATYQTALPATGVYLFRVRNGYFTSSGPEAASAGAYGLLVEVIQ